MNRDWNNIDAARETIVSEAAKRGVLLEYKPEPPFGSKEWKAWYQHDLERVDRLEELRQRDRENDERSMLE